MSWVLAGLGNTSIGRASGALQIKLHQRANIGRATPHGHLGGIARHPLSIAESKVSRRLANAHPHAKSLASPDERVNPRSVAG